MASSWRDLLPQVLAEREALAVSSVRSVSSDSSQEIGPNGPNRPNSDTTAAIVAGPQRLRSMRCPTGVERTLWQRVAGDAVRLVDDGWLDKALALGWSDLHVFGAVTNPQGDPYSDGLAVWLAGRKLLAISATTATVEDGAGWAYYHRREQVGARLLWNLGS